MLLFLNLLNSNEFGEGEAHHHQALRHQGSEYRGGARGDEARVGCLTQGGGWLFAKALETPFSAVSKPIFAAEGLIAVFQRNSNYF